VTGHFRRSGGTCRSALGKHKQCTYRIVFSPTTQGATKGQFSVGDSSLSQRQDVSLSGIGLQGPPPK
jgi:hypothetical protein